MPLSEGVSARVTAKAYASGAITANLLDDPATAPGASGGQVLRRVSSTIGLAKNTYQSNEIRSDHQIVDFRHGIRRVEGNISGEFSPGSYFDQFEAVHRDTRSALTAAIDNTVLTSITASASGSTFTFAGGDPVAAGLVVGSIFRPTGTSTANDNVNFVVTGFSGTSNRIVAVDPAPVDIVTPDTTFSLTVPGRRTIVPSTTFISRKWGIEVFHSDLNVSRLYQECRFSSWHMAIPATGLATLEFSVMGRSQYTPTTGPYFTSPTAPSGTGVLSSVDGSVLLGGVKQGVITSADITLNLTPTAAEVIGQNFSAEIFLGRAAVTGTVTAYLQDNVLIGDFVNETEVALLLNMKSTSAANSPATTIYLPRVKFGTAAVNLSGEGGQSVSFSMQALKYVGAAPGVPQTTVQITDTEIP
jgi:hypothetical protein